MAPSDRQNGIGEMALTQHRHVMGDKTRAEVLKCNRETKEFRSLCPYA